MYGYCYITDDPRFSQSTKLYRKPIIFVHFTCIAHIYTTHNFKMLSVYIDDITGGLHANDLLVLMEVSQTTL